MIFSDFDKGNCLSPNGQSWKTEIDLPVSMAISTQISDSKSVAETTTENFVN
jgi:hypothetical protein